MVKAITNNEWLDFLASTNQTKTKTTTIETNTKITKTEPIDDSLSTIPLDKLFEFYGNLILNGFSVSEALELTAKVVVSAKRTN
jgi:hypothetical protein